MSIDKIYLNQALDKKRFKPNPKCDARFLKFCDATLEVSTDEFFGTMCKPCMGEAKRLFNSAMAKPATENKSWNSSNLGGIQGFDNKKFGARSQKKGGTNE